MNSNFLDISWASLFKIGIVGIFFYILFLIKDILVLFLFAIIISILFNPLINFLQSKRIPRYIGVILSYGAVLFLIGFIISLIVPLLSQEIQQIVHFLPQYYEKTSPILRAMGIEASANLDDFMGTYINDLKKIAGNILNAIIAIFGGIFSAFFIIIIAGFFSWEEKIIEKTFILIFPKKYENLVSGLWEKTQQKVSGWFLTRIIACIFVGVLTFFSLFLLNIKYSITLGVIAGFLNFVPVVGPIISGLLLFLLTYSESLVQAIFVIVIFILIQQIENNILTPLLTKKFIDLSPILVFLSLAIGVKLWGILGAILAVPLFGVLFEFLKEYFEERKKQEEIITPNL